MCTVFNTASEAEQLKSFVTQKDHESEKSDTELSQSWTMLQFLLLGIRKYVTIYFTEPTVKKLDILEVNFKFYNVLKCQYVTLWVNKKRKITASY